MGRSERQSVNVASVRDTYAVRMHDPPFDADLYVREVLIVDESLRDRRGGGRAGVRPTGIRSQPCREDNGCLPPCRQQRATSELRAQRTLQSLAKVDAGW